MIEVAYFMSNAPDVSGTDEGAGKGTMPKDRISMSILSWACIKEVYDCHLIKDGALSNFRSLNRLALLESRFFV